ncbi:MAG: hypothetical protein H6751_10290 [Candidatus Omnitrophica bacterium]|nr:hypothetical protein [Candidatus Omnitrophota bacterium]
MDRQDDTGGELTVMDFPILRREIQNILRRPSTFLFCLLLYGLLIFTIATFFQDWKSGSYSYLNRDQIARNLFQSTVGWLYLGLGVHAAMIAAVTIVSEREQKTQEILRTAPTSGISLIFQKMFTPLSVEWLLLFGLLPIFSIIFLTGGMGPGELSHQLIGLGIWVNTCVLIGMAWSAKAKSSGRAIGGTIGVLIGLFLAGFMIEVVFQNSRVASPAWFFLPIYAFTPIPLIFSNEFVSGNMAGGDSPLRWILTWVPGVPGALLWVCHLVLQVVLFGVASRNWKHLEVAANVEELAPKKRTKTRTAQPPNRPSCADGVGAFFDLEKRVIHSMGGRDLMRRYGVGVTSLGFLLFLALIAAMQGNFDNEIYYILLFLLTPIPAILCFGLGLLSLSGERARNSSPLLLSVPCRFREIFLRRWLFLLAFTLKVFVISWSAPLGVWLLTLLVGYSNQYSEASPISDFLFMVHIMAFIPLGTLLALAGGVYAKRGLTPVLTAGFLLVFVIGFISTAVYSAVASTSSPLKDSSTLIFYVAIPVGLFCMLGAACIELGKRGILPTHGGKMILTLIGVLVIAYTIWDVASWARDYEGKTIVFGTSINVAWIRYEARWILQPLSLAALLVCWLWELPDRWWARHLMREG